MHELLEDNLELEEFLKKHSQENAKWILGLNLYLDRIDLQIEYGVSPRLVVREIVQDFLSNLERVYGSLEGKIGKFLPRFVASRLEHQADVIMGDILESTMQYVNDRINSRSENSSKYGKKPTT